MRLWVMSDLHQEVARFEWVPEPPDDFDVLVVAGDVYEGDPARGVEWVARVAGGKPSAMVLGNHEFWGRTYEDVREEARAAGAAAGVAVLDGQGWVEVGGAHFVGCTLWTDMRVGLSEATPPALSGTFSEGVDVRGPGIDRKAKVRDVLRWNAADVASLEAALGRDPLPEGPRVVVTHHAPHIESVQPRWRGSWACANSASDLSRLLAPGAADLWIHGHVHSNADYDLGTRVLCNPFGTHGLNPGFREALVVDVPDPAASPSP